MKSIGLAYCGAKHRWGDMVRSRGRLRRSSTTLGDECYAAMCKVSSCLAVPSQTCEQCVDCVLTWTVVKCDQSLRTKGSVLRSQHLLWPTPHLVSTRCTASLAWQSLI